MNILITGGLGYVGSTLIPTLFNKAEIHNIIIYDNISNNNYELLLSKLNFKSKVVFVEGNILDKQTIRNIFQTYKIDTVIHLAAKTITPMNDTGFHEFDQVNHWGTSILVEIIKEINSVKKIIYLSSFAVYGTYLKSFSEKNIPIPLSNYGKSKYLAEKEILERLPDSISKIILRTGVVYGCTLGFSPTTVLNKFIFESHFFNKIQVFGNGNQKRPFIHIERLSEVIFNTIINNNLKTEIFNIFDYNVSIKEITDILLKINPKLELIYMNRDHEMKSIELSTEESLNNKLNIKAPVTLEQNIRECLIKFSL
ncbi:NAD-dependent epimerase/dehydratase family protein [Urechidicola croceus]|uniref:NAD-dependent epimerase/dehydratase domain-containing protein n=1 Tax=Urechidicola croceus TaxID=1850246 RepID=A0A1D8P9C2_9FLAO|nr:NAD(P)-dependent oxidoreductase [Urechidicola croceus]AOW21172.1 hypothetical protein LPB138_10995 [Urechidicola croceus]